MQIELIQKTHKHVKEQKSNRISELKFQVGHCPLKL